MKKIILKSVLASIILFNGSKSLNAQTKTYPIPDIPTKIYFYDEKENEAVDMETADLEQTRRTRGYGGIGTSEQVWQTAGEKSMIRVTKKPKQHFLIKISDANFDITKAFNLVKLVYNPKTKSRELVTMKLKSWSDKTEENFETFRFTNQKVREIKNSDGDLEYVIREITVENLEPGEYVWMTGWDGRSSWFFGVD